MYTSRGVRLVFKKYVFFCMKIFFTFTNSVDPDEMQHHAAFHLGLHCLRLIWAHTLFLRSALTEDIFMLAVKKFKFAYSIFCSSGISFQEFLSMYRRLFLQCRSVVAGDVADILSPTSPNKSVSSPLSNKVSAQIKLSIFITTCISMKCEQF